MRFHYMERGSATEIADLKQLTFDLDAVGYYSMLLTYHSKNYDFLTKSLLAASNDVKMKFMIAMRTYAISPEYMAMIARSYNESFPDKLALNVLSGDLHEEETSVEDIVMFGDKISTPSDRLPYTLEWIEKFLKISSQWYTPEIMLAGHSDATRNMCNKFGFTHMSALNMHLDHLKKPDRIINKEQLVAGAMLIRETEQEAIDFLTTHNGERSIQWTIHGTAESVKKQILDLEQAGVTDLMISKNQYDNEHQRVHELVKTMIAQK